MSGYMVVAFVSFCFTGLTMINRVLEGAFITSADISVVNQVLIFRPVDVFGLFSITVPNIGFLVTGIPRLIKWDYSFFGGNAAIFQYMLYSVSALVAFGLFILMLGMLYQMFSRTRL